MAGIDGSFAQGFGSGLNRAIQALGLSGNVRQQAQMQGNLMGAQAAKFGVDAQRGADSLAYINSPAGQATIRSLFGDGALAALMAGGNADKLPGNALDTQKYRFNDQVLSNIGDPGTDPAKINTGTSLLAGKAYTPFAAVGNTGAVLNQGTGGMRIASPELLDTFGANAAASKRQVVDTPSGVQLVDTRTGVATPAVGSNGQPVMGEKSVTAQKEQRAATKAMTSAKLSMTSATSGLDRMADIAQQIINDPAVGRITGIRSMVPNIPGGGAANAQAKLESLKSQVGFAVLQAMRDASKTGGALGQVSDFENRMLQNNLAALDTKQSPEQFVQQLKQIVSYAQGAKQRMQDAYTQQYGSMEQDGGGNAQALPVAPQTPAQPQRTIVRRGTLNGRSVVQYSDGSVEFAE